MSSNSCQLDGGGRLLDAGVGKMIPWWLAENLSIQGVSRVLGAVQRIRSRALRAGRGYSGSGGRQFRIRLDFPRHYHTKLRDSPQANVQVQHFYDGSQSDSSASEDGL